MEFHVYQVLPKKQTQGRIVFSDIQQAYDELVRLHERGELFAPAKIVIHGGVYRIGRPLHFYADVPVSIEPYRQERVVVSGGRAIDHWRRVELGGKTVLCAAVPEEISELPFLYVDGRAAEPARWPKTGWLRAADADKKSDYCPSDRGNFDSFHVADGDFDPGWYDPQNITIRMIHLWHEENLKFESYRPETRRIVTSTSLTLASQKSNTEYCYFNVREALSEPGEFYFDRLAHELLYIPEDPNLPFEAEIPVVGTLVRVDSGARHLTIRGIKFRCGGNYLPLVAGERRADLRDPGCAPIHELYSSWCYKFDAGMTKPFAQAPQGAVHLPGAILFDHASDCEIADCEISGCSWYGIAVMFACSRLSIRGNKLHHLGGGGVLIMGADSEMAAREPELQVSRIVICGNHIHDCGLYFYSAVGIMILNAWGCLLEDNHIHDLFYSGLSCGWVWGYEPSMTHDIRIRHNHIHDLGKGLLSDMGGIYLLGVQPGTRVWENTVHHIVNRYYGGWGLYADEGTSHVVMERNVVYECACEGLHQHYGRENIVRWNIFALNHQSGLTVSKNWLNGYCCPGEPHAKAMTFVNNLIVTDGTPAITIGEQELFDEHRLYSDGNIFYDLSRRKNRPLAKLLKSDRPFTIKQWQAAGFDRRSTAADPGLADIRKYDFRLTADSILREYGFADTPDAVK